MRINPITAAHTLLVAALALALSGCGKSTPLGPKSAALSSATLATAQGLNPSAATQAQEAGPAHFEGSTGPGSIYTLDVPADWNHELVVYAHGIVVPAELPVQLPDVGPLRDLLLGQGYAVAISSFDENGYALKDGAQRTHQLTGLFTARFGAPQRVYLAGTSLGGLIALKLAETYPGQYAGCLSVAGPLGGTLAELDYIGTVRVLFDYFYPGVLPGTMYQVPPITDFNRQVVGPVVAAITARPDRAMALALLMEGRLPFANSQELVASILNALSFQLLCGNDFFDRTHGHESFDNSGKQYTGALPPEMLAAVNSGVTRYRASPSAVNYFSRYYTPTGDLQVPLLTLHNSRDPFVPASHETAYGSLVAQAGRTDKLVQRVRSSYGHTTFTPAEIAAAFHDLAAWIGTGEKPLP